MSNVYTGLFVHYLLHALVYSKDNILLKGQSILSILSSKLNIVHYTVMHF
jgi:uncharacterized membrane protein